MPLPVFLLSLCLNPKPKTRSPKIFLSFSSVTASLSLCLSLFQLSSAYTPIRIENTFYREHILQILSLSTSLCIALSRLHAPPFLSIRIENTFYREHILPLHRSVSITCSFSLSLSLSLPLSVCMYVYMHIYPCLSP